MYVWLTQTHLDVSWCDTMEKFGKSVIKCKKAVKINPYSTVIYLYIPVVWVRSMLQCAKIYYCTHTHATHFGNTTGFSVPVLNPTKSLSSQRK